MVTAFQAHEFTLSVRVYYEDTDAGGVIFYANYLKFLERARTEWLRTLAIDQSTLARTEQRLFVVRTLNMSYRKPAQLDDLLTIVTRVARLGQASIHFEQRVQRNQELLAEGQVHVCCIDTIHMRPMKLPATVRAKLKSI
jgi:acyl-CoA thioester hydrolase